MPKEVALYLVTVWSVTAGMRTSLIARSSGSSNSAKSGNVLRKLFPMVPQTESEGCIACLRLVIWRTLRI